MIFTEQDRQIIETAIRHNLGVRLAEAVQNLLTEHEAAERKLATVTEQIEDRREALQRISGWANEAYPTEFFPDQDLERADEVLAAAGIRMGAMHGQWARHLIGGIGKIAKEALDLGEQPQSTPTQEQSCHD